MQPDNFWSMPSRPRSRSVSDPFTSSEYWTKSGFNQYASHFVALVALNLDSTLLDGAPGAACFLHRFGQLLFLGQANSHEAADHGYSLASTMRGLADDINPPA